MLMIFLQSLVIGYSGAVMPGPMFTYTVDKGLRYGIRPGLEISLGHVFLELLLVIAIFAGAGKFLGSDAAKIVIGIFGGSILGYLGSGMIRDVYKGRISLDIKAVEGEKKGNAFAAGILLSATNPYFIIWWSAVGLALIMNAYNTYGIIGIAVFYIGHSLSDISWFTFVAALVSKARHLFSVRVYKGVILFLAACLIFFGISFFADSIDSIMRLM
jgi:threonine/homoserine/homoserine lactone efflux protein